jgi:renalase
MTKTFLNCNYYSFVLSLFSISSMMNCLGRSARIAVLGSGISGATCASILKGAGHSVSVFECGRGVGGRTSTRRTRDDNKFAFDHGAQYMGTPESTEFEAALKDWIKNGFVSEWKGDFYTASILSSTSEWNLVTDVGRHYVGYPAMNSISRELLSRADIEVVLQTRACASTSTSMDGDDNGLWRLHAAEDGRDLGSFDWLVCSDRLSAMPHRSDLSDIESEATKLFRELISDVTNIPSLTLMLAFEKKLDIEADGIKFGESCGGSLGWAGRDTSKPGRDREDGRDLWVVQSSPGSAQALMDRIAEEGRDFEGTKKRVADEAAPFLYDEFTTALRAIKPDIDIPEVNLMTGHRWSAAFPSKKVNISGTCNEPYYLDEESHLACCGDYFTAVGRIEGAYLSGAAAAKAILATIDSRN